MFTERLRITTGDREFTDITTRAEQFLADCGAHDGLLTVFVPHATAGVALIETGAGTEADLAATIDRLLPRADIYTHRHGSSGHGRDHVLPGFISPSVTIPVQSGRMLLGTWQSVVLVDPNVDNPNRTVVLSLLPG